MKKEPARIPKQAFGLLRHILPRRDSEYLMANFKDLYEHREKNQGRFKARIWIWMEILKSLPGFIYSSLYWRITMFKNYFIITLRNIRKHTLHSVINIAGLSLGLFVCLLIFLWVQNELGYDRFHVNKDNIAQVYSETQYSSGSTHTFMGSYYPLAKILKQECPEIKEAVRYETATGISLRFHEKQFSNDTVGLADPAFFNVFSFSFIKGNPETAIDNNYSVVLTEKMAQKYFGNSDPMGKTLTLNNEIGIQVTGVIKDVPAQSSLQLDCVAPYALKFAPDFKEPEHWGGNPLNTYVLLQKKSDFSQLEQKITSVVDKHAQWETAEVSFYLHPLKKKHLYSPQGGGLIQSLLIFSAIALFVLFIAVVNFVNLSTAQATTRAKEVGVRKVVGARKTDLIGQFMGESLVISFITLVLASGFLALLLPFFNQLMGKQFSLNLLLKPEVIFGFLGLALITGIFAGVYPAFYLSRIQPGNTMKGLFRVRNRGSSRKILVAAQFSLSIIMIISTLVVFKQLNYMMSTDLGFDKENLLVLQMSRKMQEGFEPLRNDLLNNPQVESVTKSLQGPWHIGSTVSAVDWKGKAPDEKVSMHWDYVGYDYFSTLKMNIIEGRAFSREFPTDPREAYIVNEEAVKLMGMESPAGKPLSVFRNQGQIIGVVKNFHFQPLTHDIKPFVFMLRPDSGSLVFIRIRPENIPTTLKNIRTLLAKHDPSYQENLLFFNDVLSQYIYTSEEKTGKIAGCFTLLAVLISSIGLFGLSSFMAQQRTKEIGIRKIVGASISNIMSLVSKEFLVLLFVSNVIAWPVAYLVMKNFLEKYSYRTHIGIELFILSGLAAFLIALLTISYQAIKAARANPADSLRCE